MIDPLRESTQIAFSGLGAQSVRLRVISENIANARSTGDTPGADPFARKIVSFERELDRVSGAPAVRVKNISADMRPFKLEHDPGNPAADADGMVKTPNVDVLVELSDMREANRSYEANLQVVKQTNDLISMTINMLKDG